MSFDPMVFDEHLFGSQSFSGDSLFDGAIFDSAIFDTGEEDVAMAPVILGGDTVERDKRYKRKLKEEEERRRLIQALLTKAHEGELPAPLAAKVIAKATPYLAGKSVPESVLQELEAIARDEEDIEILVLH